MWLVSDSCQNQATLDAADDACELTDLGNENGAERRRGLRIRQTRPVKVFEPMANRYFGGQTEDVSATGLRIELPGHSPIQPGELLNIHVGLDPRGHTLANRRQMIPARVVWVKRDRRLYPGRVEAGVEFLATLSAQTHAA